jgi:hypothetical protein
MDLDVVRLLAEFAPAGQEPMDELLAAGGWRWRAIGEDRGGLPS